MGVEDNEWMNTEFHVGNTTTGLVNEVPSYCADSVHGWTFFNGSDWVRSRDLISSCTSIEHTCCTSIDISSGDWLVSDKVGQDEGFISHVGGSVCAEDAG